MYTASETREANQMGGMEEGMPLNIKPTPVDQQTLFEGT